MAWSSGDLFQFFVVQQQQLAMMQMGKILHPATGKLERDLDGARFSIDLLGMLEEKTRGNLTEEESRLLGQVLTNLRLNFVEESRKPAPETAEGGSEARAAQDEGAGAGEEESAEDREGSGNDTESAGDRQPADA